ncbi:hypothetical protein ACOHYD_13715 [Desulfobacterota bacterium M19]
MPFYAIRVHSPNAGLLKEEISAFDIKSHEDAREKGPFCDHKFDPVYWKDWGKRKDGKIIKRHFCKYADKKRSVTNFAKRIIEENETIKNSKQKTPHKKFQTILIQVLNQYISSKKKIEWAFKNEEISDFSLCGNLLQEADLAVKEYRIYPPFVNYYDLDIAILGKNKHNEEVILAGIEIEYSHKAELLKTLLCKSLGFPLFSINICDLGEDDVNEEICINRLTETKSSSEDKKRRNYIYIHSLLHPIYLSGYQNWCQIKDSHQFIIFPRKNEGEVLRKSINELIQAYNVEKFVTCTPVRLNPNVQSSVTMFRNESSIFLDYIHNYDETCFLRLKTKRLIPLAGDLYKFHLAFTQLVSLKYTCLVSYKYQTGSSNWDHDEPYWHINKLVKNPKGHGYHSISKKMCVKRLSVPIREIMKFLP